jgi:hypothetical protein
MNASRGMPSFPGMFAYMPSPGKVKRLNNLVDMMRMVTGKSSLALATLAIFHKGPSFDNHQVGTNIYCMLLDCK